MAEFLAMGGYAQFVWPAFGVVLALMAGLLGVSWRNWRRTTAALETLQRERRARVRAS